MHQDMTYRAQAKELAKKELKIELKMLKRTLSVSAGHHGKAPHDAQG